jgi:hypothetical protein
MADIGWSCSGLACYRSVKCHQGIAFPTSVYTLPLSLVSSVGGWDTGPGAIGEDMHMMLKCYFATGGHLNIESIASPASMSNATSGSTGWSGWLRNHKARYFQGLRHMWGCLDSGYAVVRWWRMEWPSSTSSGNKDDGQDRDGPGVEVLNAYGRRHAGSPYMWLRNAELFLRLFEAHILPLHISCILIASSYYSSYSTPSNNSRYLELTLQYTELLRTVNGILMAICLSTAYAGFYKTCVQARQWEMRKAGLHEFTFGPSTGGRWSLGSILDILSLPITTMVFGTLPLLQAVLSHCWTDALIYRVTGKPVNSKSHRS